MQNKCKICGEEISEFENYLRIRPRALMEAGEPAIYACEKCTEKKGGAEKTEEYLVENFVKKPTDSF